MNKRILLVEDSESYRTLTTSVLAKEGYEVIQAISGKQAIEKTKDNPHYDLFLLDYALRDMTAESFLIHLHDNNQYMDIPKIVISSEASKEHKQKVQKYGVVAWFTKPADLEGLVQALKERVFSETCDLDKKAH